MKAALFALGLCACTAEEARPAPRPAHLEGDMALELRDAAHVVIDAGDERKLAVTITPSATYGLLPSELAGEGRLDPFPEAGSVLYTAKLAAPAQKGPCGDKPISLALSLHRAAGTMVIGSLAAYCGANRWYGSPVRVLRLAGSLGS